MISKYFANWKSYVRISVVIMMLVVTVLAVNPISVQAKASDYTRDVEGWLQSCQKVGNDLTKYNFTYGSHSKSTFANSVKNGRKANCASYVSWCLQEFGILKKGQTFYTDRGRLIKRFKSWKGKVEIIQINKKAGKVKNLKPGDIVAWGDITHTNIYAGQNAQGEKLWLDGGSAATYESGARRYYRADKIMTYDYLNKHKIAFVIRIKGL